MKPFIQATSSNPISPHQGPVREPRCVAPPGAGWHDRMLERRFQAILTPILLKFDGCLTGAIFQFPNVYAGPDGLTAPTPQRAPPHPWLESPSVPLPSVVALFDPPLGHPGIRRFCLHPNQSEVIRSNPRQSEVPGGDHFRAQRAFNPPTAMAWGGAYRSATPAFALGSPFPGRSPTLAPWNQV